MPQVFPNNTLRPSLEAQKTTEAREGLAALPSLIALVLALESDSFILTRISDWSTLIDSLREWRVDPLCSGCTSLTDMTALGTTDLTAEQRGAEKGRAKGTVGAKDIV